MKIVSKIVKAVGADNVIHFLAGFCIVALGFPFGKNAVALTFPLALILGVLKEYIDKKTDGVFDGGEMLATWIGAMVSTAYAFFMWELI